MADYSIIFLTRTWEETGNVNERYDRNIEGVAEAYEARTLT
jgi:hypothetical protein